MRKVIITVVSFAVLLGTAAMPWTAISQEAIPAAAPNSSLIIPAAAFQEVDNTYLFTFGIYFGLNSGSGNFVAPVFLPNGARIRKIKLTCIDAGLSEITARLFRQRIGIGGSIQISLVISNGVSGTQRTFGNAAVNNRIVNTFRYGYYIEVELPGTKSDYKVYQIQILYDAPGTF